jgi:hypothetical protein
MRSRCPLSMDIDDIIQIMHGFAPGIDLSVFFAQLDQALDDFLNLQNHGQLDSY